MKVFPQSSWIGSPARFWLLSSYRLPGRTVEILWFIGPQGDISCNKFENSITWDVQPITNGARWSVSNRAALSWQLAVVIIFLVSCHVGHGVKPGLSKDPPQSSCPTFRIFSVQSTSMIVFFFLGQWINHYFRYKTRRTHPVLGGQAAKWPCSRNLSQFLSCCLDPLIKTPEVHHPRCFGSILYTPFSGSLQLWISFCHLNLSMSLQQRLSM